VWRPKTIRGFGGAPLESTPVRAANHLELGSAKEALVAWMPYLVLIFVVVAWTGPWSRMPLISWLKLSVSAQSSVTHKPIFSTFNFAPFGGGTSTLVAWLVILAILRPSGEMVKKIFSRTLHQMWGALLVAFFIFALAYVFVFTGMANSLAYGFSKIGVFFVVLAPILGWIGVALSGSNTATNAMFGPVQAMTGRLLNLPVLMLPSFIRAEPITTRRAPSSNISRALSAVRNPPPTWQRRRCTRERTRSRLSPCPRAASRSTIWTSGYLEKRSNHGSKSSNSSAFFSPCTSWTILLPIKSMEGISTATSPGCRRPATPA